MDFIVPLIFLFIVYRIIAGAIKKQTAQGIDWGNVGANIQNAQNAIRDASANNGAYGQATSVSPKQNTSTPQKGTLEHLRSVQDKMATRNEKAPVSKTTSPWATQANQTTAPSHKRNHIHSGNDYNKKKYDAADMFDNNSVHANKVLNSCTPAVRKGWRDKGDRGKTVER